jgi:transposase
MVDKKSREQGTPDGLQVRNPRAAGIDIGSRQHWVAVPGGSGEQLVRSFESFTADLSRLADWLRECGVNTVAMESTGVYWIPLFDVLEERGFEVLLVNAAHIRNVPGRKTDVRDCQWIQQLHSYGLLRGSFRPTADILELRAYMRHRDTLVESAARHVLHMQKALMQMNIQIHHVLADITGVTGMRILRALVGGQYDPQALAEHRDPRCRASREKIAAALRGTYKTEHLFALKQALSLYDNYQQNLQECDHRIEAKLSELAAASASIAEPPPPRKRRKPCGHEPAFEIRSPLYRVLNGVDLTQVPGIGHHTALNILGEIGTDITRWPTADHFASWLNLSPGSKITGGKSLTGRRPPSKSRTGQLLRQAATSVGRTATALGAFYRRLGARAGKARPSLPPPASWPSSSTIS